MEVVSEQSVSAPPVARTTGARAGASGAGIINVYVSGAVDPESTARQVKRILTGHERRIGTTAARL